ncbi:MAG: cupredoxin domain-containing protein [Candidatus Eiseniibacteriota bacterium]
MSKRAVVAGILLVGLAAGAFALSCGGKSSSPTNPGGGGGSSCAELNSGNIANGAAFAHTFNTAGSFSYHCTLHGGMTGTVVVAGSTAPTHTDLNMVTGGAYPMVNCPMGSVVQWHNASGTTHTVTSN